MGQEHAVNLTTSDDEGGWKLTYEPVEFNPVAIRFAEVDHNWWVPHPLLHQNGCSTAAEQLKTRDNYKINSRQETCVGSVVGNMFMYNAVSPRP